MLFDSAGLGYSVKSRRVFVHYPFKDEDGATAYGGGFQIDYPFRYPDGNDATRERVALIEKLLGQGSDPVE